MKILHKEKEYITSKSYDSSSWDERKYIILEIKKYMKELNINYKLLAEMTNDPEENVEDMLRDYKRLSKAFLGRGKRIRT